MLASRSKATHSTISLKIKLSSAARLFFCQTFQFSRGLLKPIKSCLITNSACVWTINHTRNERTMTLLHQKKVSFPPLYCKRPIYLPFLEILEACMEKLLISYLIFIFYLEAIKITHVLDSKI